MGLRGLFGVTRSERYGSLTGALTIAAVEEDLLSFQVRDGGQFDASGTVHAEINTARFAMLNHDPFGHRKCLSFELS